MKLQRQVCVGLSVIFLLLGLSIITLAADNPRITIDENGNGTLVFPVPPTFPTTGTLQPATR